ncbi:AraC family transcriptional regulator [Pyxidicoccus parkwayensis]|uniref:AraC family transcriptional regulator n=1 Tax=Pyxidicoccus parkwayensis TaxID=2813578 RepID=A0ABX7P4W1_9BACT|nr:AraC family transcriptional regulator [Pyxidicoccus parkwaysis]QSQ25519.1 AraC family transcriptional regulator [Pyxidicoccus parkwaysis]
MVDKQLWAPVDPLGEALHFLRMTGSFYCQSELSAPWGLGLPPMSGCMWFHVVTAGQCTLEVGDAAPVALRPGDLALVPHGEGHCLRSEPRVATPLANELPQQQVSERYSVLRHGGGGTPATLVCGAVRFDHPAAHAVVRLLPRVIHLDAASSPHADWMESTLKLMAAEARALRPGGETVITRLADILVVQAIRSWIQQDPAAQTGWLGALQDKQLGRAIMLIHREPAHPWTLASLASAVAMSRSAFAARFTELVGEPAMHYVARWRMHMAVTLLKEDSAGLGELASRLGYQSEAAFSRAFKRFIGVSPGAMRRDSEATARPRIRRARTRA